jgi:UDP-glucuronate 4-epimerase
VVRVLDRPAAPNPDWNPRAPDPASSSAPFRLYNIGNGRPVELPRFVEALERALDKPAIKRYLPMQPGDVPETWADTRDLEREFGFRPATPVEEGIARFVDWYRGYYRG